MNLGNRKSKQRCDLHFNIGTGERREPDWKPLDIDGDYTVKGMDGIHNAVIHYATRLSKKLRIPEEEFWSEAVPMALYRVLYHFGNAASFKAAFTYISHNFNLEE